MKFSGTPGRMLAALAVTWTVTCVAPTTAAAQMPLLLDEILMADTGNQDGAAETAVAVDGTGRLLKLTRAEARAHATVSEAGMPEFLEFDAAKMLQRFDTATPLSAEDYRYPVSAAPDSWGWIYDGDPLDRGNYKNELRAADGTRERVPGTGARTTQVSSLLAARARQEQDRATNGYVIDVLIRTPRYVMNTIRTFYHSGKAPYLGIGIVLFLIGMATMVDLLRSEGRA